MSRTDELATVIAALLAAQAPTDTAPAPTLLTVAETAETLRCGQTMVYQLLKDGRLPSVKIGRRRLVRAADVAEFIARGGAAAA
jgi:excisionase family DNA binding protein